MRHQKDAWRWCRSCRDGRICQLSEDYDGTAVRKNCAAIWCLHAWQTILYCDWTDGERIDAKLPERSRSNIPKFNQNFNLTFFRKRKERHVLAAARYGRRNSRGNGFHGDSQPCPSRFGCAKRSSWRTTECHRWLRVDKVRNLINQFLMQSKLKNIFSRFLKKNEYKSRSKCFPSDGPPPKPPEKTFSRCGAMFGALAFCSGKFWHMETYAVNSLKFYFILEIEIGDVLDYVETGQRLAMPLNCNNAI